MKRIFFSVDAHGANIVWRKWLSAVNMYHADILILSGDLTGKVFVPIIKQKDNTWQYSYFGTTFTLKNEDEVKAAVDRLNNAAIYPFIATGAEVSELQKDEKKLQDLMNKLIWDRLDQWLKMLVKAVDTSKVMTIVMPGNDDFFIFDDLIKSYANKGVIYPLDEAIQFPYGIEMVSCAYVNPTPWNTDREADEGKLEKMLETEINRLKDPHWSIFNFHAPPHNTKLDIAPKLDKTLKPVVSFGDVDTEHVGSKAVRKVEEKYQPLMGVHGHIHESFASDYIKKTPVVNPGSEYSEGILRAFIIEIEEDGIKNYWKIEG